MNEVFISQGYGGSDRLAQMIRDYLAVRGVDCCVDQGQDEEVCLEQLSEARCLLLLLTDEVIRQCIEKPNNRIVRQLWYAQERQIRFLTVVASSLNAADYSAVYELLRYIRMSQTFEIDPLPATESIEKLADTVCRSVSAGSKPGMRPLTFFRDMEPRLDENSRVDLAFHSGMSWLHTGREIEGLQSVLPVLAEKHVPVRVLLNSQDAVSMLWPRMNPKKLEHMSLAECLAGWQRLAQRYGNISLRISDAPLLHLTYIVSLTEKVGAANVRYYTYGDDEKEIRHVYTEDNEEFAVLKAEFETLWEDAKTVK